MGNGRCGRGHPESIRSATDVNCPFLDITSWLSVCKCVTEEFRGNARQFLRKFDWEEAWIMIVVYQGKLIRGVNGSTGSGESQSQRLALSREPVLGRTGWRIIPICWARLSVPL